MFDPWYTGPLLTPSASMMPPGYANIQPYVFVTQGYAAFDEDRSSVPFEHDVINFNPIFIAQTGVTNSVDTMVSLQTQTNWQRIRRSAMGGRLFNSAANALCPQDEVLYSANLPDRRVPAAAV